MIEGKKGILKRLDLVPDNEFYYCYKCYNTLVQLRTATGEAYVLGKKTYRKLYWICVCTNEKCLNKFKEVKTLKSINEVISYPLMGKYNDRGVTSGR